MYGFRANEVERIIRHSLNENPDLKYYINNDYIDELMNLLVSGISKAIEENNKKIVDDIENDIKRKTKVFL